jgi:hypothetical protein
MGSKCKVGVVNLLHRAKTSPVPVCNCAACTPVASCARIHFKIPTIEILNLPLHADGAGRFVARPCIDGVLSKGRNARVEIADHGGVDSENEEGEKTRHRYIK